MIHCRIHVSHGGQPYLLADPIDERESYEMILKDTPPAKKTKRWVKMSKQDDFTKLKNKSCPLPFKLIYIYIPLLFFGVEEKNATPI